MADQSPILSPPSSVHNTELHQRQSFPTNRPIRQDTRASIDSIICTPLVPGFYKIPFHGNCPRCHHRHVAAEVKVEVTPGYTKPSYVRCENCKEKWVALGGRNSTCISLLSTLTVEPDPMENDARRAIINMVRSISSVASPVLNTVPEGSVTRNDTAAFVPPNAEGPSQRLPGPSIQDPGEEQLETHPPSGPSAPQRFPHLPVRSRGHSRGSAPSSNRTAVSNKDVKRNKHHHGKEG